MAVIPPTFVHGLFDCALGGSDARWLPNPSQCQRLCLQRLLRPLLPPPSHSFR